MKGQCWEATEASVVEWAPEPTIDWDAACGPVRPPRGAGALPAEVSH